MKSVALLVCLFWLGACATKATDNTTGACTAATAVAANAVSIQGVAYVPNCFKVSSGDLVTFTNHDSFTHTVSSDIGQTQIFDSQDIASGTTYQQKFNSKGSVTGHCNYHSTMHFTAIVQ